MKMSIALHQLILPENFSQATFFQKVEKEKMFLVCSLQETPIRRGIHGRLLGT